MLPVGPNMQAVRDGWIELCSRYQWDWFCTMTFADAVHPERAFKTWRYWVSQLNRDLFGRHWQGTEHGGVYWVRGSEYQRRGVLHYHALMSAVNDLDALTYRWYWKNLWNDLAGFAMIDKIKDEVAAMKYVTKYVVKGGDIDVSENLKWYVRQKSLVW
ncbi:MAG: rolling circle replication-associated protein [Gammaproteobacteria bacterium]